MIKWLWRALLVFVIWYVATQPAAAAHLGHHIMGLAQNAGTAFSTFLNGI